MKEREGPSPIDVRQGWHRKHRLIHGSFDSTATETATECFSPIDLDGGRMLAVDLRLRVRRPVTVGAAATVYAGIFQASFSAVADGRKAGAENIVADVGLSGVKTARVSRVSDLQANMETVTFAFDNVIDLRPDIPWLLYTKIEGDAAYVLDPHNFGSAPVPYTGTWPRRATLLRRMASTTIYAPALELRSAYGRFYFGDPATEK